ANRDLVATRDRRHVRSRSPPPARDARIRGLRPVTCRHCGGGSLIPFADLGTAPPSNAYIPRERLKAPEQWFPLRVVTCTECWLAQTVDFAKREDLFSADYAYFSSYSTSWVKHAEAYVEAMIDRLTLDRQSLAIEVAANDGYLLQHFKA